jgi:ubiquinone/menaquinone biosynthesis C-methylase UbiE
LNRKKLEEGNLIEGNFYPKYSTQNFIANYLTQNFVRTLLDTVASVEAHQCLDVGSGEGFLLKCLHSQFPHLRIISSDISKKMQALAQQNTSLGGIVASAEILPLANHTVDLVLACEVLEHLDQPEKALAEMSRISRSFCILSVPREPIWRFMNVARLSYLSSFGNTPGHIQHWSRHDFLNLVSQYFTVVQVRNPFPWTFVVGKK